MRIVEHSYIRQIILSFPLHSMALITQFDDLPDLFIIDLFPGQSKRRRLRPENGP